MKFLSHKLVTAKYTKMSTCQPSMQFCPNFYAEKHTGNMGTTFPQSRHTTNTVSTYYRAVLFSHYPQKNRSIIHPLRVSYLCYNHMFISDDMPLYNSNKSRHRLIVSLKAFKSFKLILSIVACFQN